jgi:hypothetical protein
MVKVGFSNRSIFRVRLTYSNQHQTFFMFIKFLEVAYCDFYIREWGNPNKSHRYTIQCVLPINLFNQQIFIFIWIWFNLIFLYNVIDIIKWCLRCSPCKLILALNNTGFN